MSELATFTNGGLLLVTELLQQATDPNSSVEPQYSLLHALSPLIAASIYPDYLLLPSPVVNDEGKWIIQQQGSAEARVGRAEMPWRRWEACGRRFHGTDCGRCPIAMCCQSSPHPHVTTARSSLFVSRIWPVGDRCQRP